MPSFLPRKAKPTLSLTDMVANEDVVANRKRLWGAWRLHCQALPGMRESHIEAMLANMPDITLE